MMPPGATIGILGGGQLGRMLILAGRPLGYRFHVFEPKGPSAAGAVADLEINAPYTDAAALARFAETVDLMTLEFENIPVEAIDRLAAIRPVCPGRKALYICQHREREKAFLKAAGLPHARFEYADAADALEAAVARTGYPCVIKTAAFGYDGKGQVKLSGPGDLANPVALWTQLGEPLRVVVEEWVEHMGEFSVVCARREDGASSTLPMAENQHRNHILHSSVVPSRTAATVREKGAALARSIADELEVVGLLAVEFFLHPERGLIVNEMAPRPHNSGHYSIDGCLTSQFEQHIRAICGLPLGSTELLRASVMVNLLGDLWERGEPDWARLLSDPRVKLHLYDKGQARPGRKMGHFTLLDADRDAALEAAAAHFDALRA